MELAQTQNKRPLLTKIPISLKIKLLLLDPQPHAKFKILRIAKQFLIKRRTPLKFKE
jgi:hypothetical protein